MQDTSTQTLDFNKKISVNFEGGELSGETGMLLVEEFCKGFGVKKLLEKFLPEHRKGSFVYSKPEILYQEMMRIITGYSSNNTAENSIEEGKNGFSWDHLSHKCFNQSRAKFQVFLLAYQITNFFKRFCVPVEREKSSIQTLRILLFKVASKLVKGRRKFIFKCASSFPYQKLWQKTLENIQFISAYLTKELSQQKLYSG